MIRLAGHRTRALVGIAAGAVNLGLGAAYLGDGGSRGAFGIVNLALGTTAAILGVRALSAKSTGAASKSPRLALAPIATPGTRLRFGFAGNLKF